MADRSVPVVMVCLLVPQQATSGSAATPVANAPLPSGYGEDLSPWVTSLEYEESEKKDDVCKIQLRNNDLRFFDHDVFTKGTKLLVTWGYAGHTVPPRVVTVQKCTGSLTLTVEARGAGALLNKQNKSRVFTSMTRSQVVAQIAKENGYEAEVQYIERTTMVYPHITQAGQTDAQFLKKLANQERFEFYPDFDGLHWHPRRVGQKPCRVLQYYLPPLVGDVITFSVDNDISGKPGQIATAGRDPLNKKDVGGSASDSETQRNTTSTSIEVIDQRTGASHTGQVNVASAETRTTAETDNTSAKKVADGSFLRTQQAAVLLSLDIVGDPGLLSKSVVKVDGISKRLSGRYFVISIAHKVEPGSGFGQKLKTRADGTSGAKAAASEAKPNTQQASNDPNALNPVEVIDPRTGAASVQYRDTRGRQN